MKDNKDRPGYVGVTRRGLLAAGAVAGGSIVAPAWAGDKGPAIEFAHESCGEDAAGPRILVGYASMCGSTGEIAAAVGGKLCEAGAQVDVRRLSEITDIGGYDAFVIGSAIHGGMWLPEAFKFLRGGRKKLANAPVAYFIACMALSADKKSGRRLARGYVEWPLKVAPKIKPVSLGMFAGKVDYAKLPRRYRPVMRGIVPQDLDARNWEAIGQWGEELADQLVKA